MSTTPPNTAQDEDPWPLFNVAMAFTASSAVITAVEVDLFSALDEPRTASQIKTTFNFHQRAIPVFLDSLVALGVLHRSGFAEEALYSNTPSAAAFLSRSSPRYMGEMLKFSSMMLYKGFGSLRDALQTGTAQMKDNHPGFDKTLESWNAQFEKDGKEMHFLRGVAAMNSLAHRRFAQLFDFSQNSTPTLIDLGGSLGQLCCEVAKANPHVRCISLDLPPVESHAVANVKENGVSDQVEIRSADFWNDDIGINDVVVMSMVAHDYSLSEKKKLFRKSYEALAEGGRLVVIEMFIDDERKNNMEGFMMSLNMLIETVGGFDYTPSEFDEWAREAGFKRTEFMKLQGPIDACVAFK